MFLSRQPLKMAITRHKANEIAKEAGRTACDKCGWVNCECKTNSYIKTYIIEDLDKLSVSNLKVIYKLTRDLVAGV